MKPLAVILNLLACIPLLLILPLAPFTFILVDGEGARPGMSQEYLFHVLMIGYPLVAVVCAFLALRYYRQNERTWPLALPLLPIGLFVGLVLVFMYGGIQLL